MQLFLWISGFLLIACFLTIIPYNRMVSLRNNVKRSRSDIDTQIRARSDLLGNLVETVKGYAAHEKGIMDSVSQARTALMGTSNKTLAQADDMITTAVGKLFALQESYPELKANQNFLALQQEMSVMEGKIASSRRYLNSAVAEYNSLIESFPNVLIASKMNFKPEEMFELSMEEKIFETRSEKVKF